MIFSSTIFLFLFLPVTLTGYYLLHRPYRNVFLLLMSLLFYAWGEQKFVVILVLLIVFNYLTALLIGAFREKSPAAAKGFLVLAVAGNLLPLFVYKYLDFALTNLNHLGLALPLTGLLLPLGISFFTFQAISYQADVYRGRVTAQKKPWNVGLYMALFPQLVAGPIVRYQTVAEELVGRRETFADFSEGVRRFLLGLCKKVLLANNMALIADNAFALTDGERSVVYAWIGALAYSFQILFDFSGYSDMAIGLGRMFGFHFLENFNYPYISKSVSEFWRRWHISLGQWFRDYIYFPLGGSRVDRPGRLLFNLFVVWLLTGVWHGASWNFIIWGLLYFLLIAFEKRTGYPKKLSSPAKRGGYQILTLLAVLLGWVLFRAEGGGAAAGYLASLFGLTGNPLVCYNVLAALREYGFFLLAAVLCATPLFLRLRERVDRLAQPGRSVANLLSVALYLFGFLWAVSFLVMGAHNPFIYFNF
jgi:alginate O-acetyltransferase complex protein AlgI